jgi:hypothetical protein
VSEVLFSLLAFVVDNMEKFQTNSDSHGINTRHKHDLHMPNANLTSYQISTYYAGTKLFGLLPYIINSLIHDPNCIKSALLDYILRHS